MSLATVGFLTVSVACGDGSGEEGTTFPVNPVDASPNPAVPTHTGVLGSDASTYVPPGVVYDAGVTSSVDASSSPYEAGGPSYDAGPASTDTGSTRADAGGFSFPDLFPRDDAGTTEGGSGVRDVNGPCKDLNLLCFDFIDMWINAECQTCNSGQGCMGCDLPFAY